MSTRLTLGPADLEEGELRGYAVGQRNVLIARVGGVFKALDDWCNHAGCLLSGGHLERNMVVCPCHEIGFDLDTGHNVTSPRIADHQNSFKVEVEDGQLIVIGFDAVSSRSIMGHDGHDHEHEHGDHEHAHPVAEHRAQSPTSVSAFVITCSDTRTPKTDDGGKLVCELLERAGHSIVGTALVKDEAREIRRVIDDAIIQGPRVVIITGGTGLSKRDVTIETLTPMFDKAIPGFGELFRMLSFEQVKSAAMLSRAVAGVVKGVVVFAMPGSPDAVKLAMERLVIPELGHFVREALR